MSAHIPLRFLKLFPSYVLDATPLPWWQRLYLRLARRGPRRRIVLFPGAGQAAKGPIGGETLRAMARELYGVEPLPGESDEALRQRLAARWDTIRPV